MKIAGVVALRSFPKWKNCILNLSELCDKVFVRFDAMNGDPEILQQVEGVLGEKFGGCAIVDGWGVPDWREDELKLVDDYAPDVVLCPDEDEAFDDGMYEELKAFMASDKSMMMFSYNPLISNDGRTINNDKPYPDQPHGKAFKWRKGLSYFPYHGNAKIAQYFMPSCHWNATTKINHYAAWTPAMEAAKKWRSDTPNGRAIKAVTLLGFGPTADGPIDVRGEVWSCNNCYEGMTPEAYNRCTRIFEMHDLAKRERVRAKDGKLHLSHLDEAAKQGRRIIMQDATDRITNSESFPIDALVTKMGVDWFMGTPCYMLAQAIYEGYNQIMVYGIDQMDWEHTLQRECFGFWVGYGLGLGIHIGGRLTFLERHQGRRYGYDWGPELDEKAMELMWLGHPIQVQYKEQSQPMRGDLHKFAEKKGWPFTK